MTESDNSLGRECQALLDNYIQTFEELESVLVLAREDRPVTIRDVATISALPEPAVELALRRLVSAGLVTEGPDGYRIDRADLAIAAGVDQLRAQHGANRLAVMSQMTANALNRVRTSAMRTFARAFLLGNRDDG